MARMFEPAKPGPEANKKVLPGKEQKGVKTPQEPPKRQNEREGTDEARPPAYFKREGRNERRK